MRSVKECSVHFWPNFIFPCLLSILHYSEHMQLETTQTMNVRVRCHFSQHLLFVSLRLLQKQCKNGTVLHCLALNHYLLPRAVQKLYEEAHDMDENSRKSRHFKSCSPF